MQVKGLSSELIELRSIEDVQLAEIHKHHNRELRLELSDFMNLEFPWVPLNQTQIKAKLEEMQKEERTALFGIWSRNNEFMGLGCFAANWDPWCPFINIIIWPQCRRKGYGTEAARLLLEAAFNNSIAHVIGCSAPEWNPVGIDFAESLGFKRAGASRRSGFIDGKFFDRFYFDMLRDEYMAHHAKKAGD
jgi:RimJ/RimL family protein N-acetyltransferase